MADSLLAEGHRQVACKHRVERRHRVAKTKVGIHTKADIHNHCDSYAILHDRASYPIRDRHDQRAPAI